MWSCCAVEREHAKPSPALTKTEPPKKKSSLDRFAGGNGRNIGLGLMAKQGQLSERPEAANNGAEVPSATEPMWKGGSLPQPVIPKQPSHHPPDMDDASASQDSPPPSPVSPNNFRSVSSTTSLSKMLRSRSSRLLMEDGEEPEVEDVAAQQQQQAQQRSPLQKRKSFSSIVQHNNLNKSGSMNSLTAIAEDLQDDVGGSGSSRRQSFVASMTSSVKARLFTGSKNLDGTTDDGAATTKSPASASSSSKSPPKSDKKPSSSAISEKSALLRRNSQLTYAESAQTAIVFDWDDTLFPTSYLIDDLRLNHKKLLKDQRLPRSLYQEVAESMQELEMGVVELLKLAHARGKVILVTLARPPWVEDSCRVFFSSVGDLIRQLGIKVVYAQQGVTVDYDKRRMMGDEEVERFYAEMKGKAISREVDAFYSQYEGQSWKNIISIGDSDFERLGTMMMTQEYMRRRGLLKGVNDKTFEVTVASNEAFGRNTGTIDVNGHVYKVRTKTFKMLDCPTIGELKEEIHLLHTWLPKMVELDDGFDADLSALDDPQLVDQIEAVLNGPIGAKRANGRPKR